MEAIRKKKIRRVGKQVIIDLPESFQAEEVDVILWASKDESSDSSPNLSVENWRKDLINQYSKFNIDLSGLSFNRDELYDR